MTRAAYEVARTILEGPPDNGEHGPGPEIPRGAPKGERPRRRGTQVPHADRMSGLPDMRRKGWVRPTCEIDRKPGAPGVRKERKDGVAACVIERGHCAPVTARREGASQASERHGAPPAPLSGAANERVCVGKCELRRERKGRMAGNR